MTTVSERPDYGAFIPSYLDDYPLKPCEFRVYARILRRAGTKGGHHWEGIPATAKACGMNVKTVRAAVRLLQITGMIILHEVPGRPNNIQPTHHDQWVEPSQVGALRDTLTPTKKTPTELGRGTKTGSTELGRAPLPNQVPGATELGRAPLPREADEGIPSKVPSEGNPLKVINTPLPPKGGDVFADRKLEEPGQGEERQAEASTTIEAKAIEPLSTGKAGAGKKGSARRRGKPKNAAAMYDAIADRDGFEAFWIWYREKICPIRAKSRDGVLAAEGSKTEAAWAWVQLEATDFLGQGREGFKEGCSLQWAKYDSTAGLGIPNACRFLNPGSGEPPWLERLQEKAAPVVAESFLPEPATKPDGGRPFDRLSSVRGAQTAVTGLLRSLNRPSVLPDDWQAKTGKQIVSQLTATELAEFAEYLKLELNGHAV